MKQSKRKIGLHVDVLYRLQDERGWNDTRLAKELGISRSRLWRARLPVDHPEHNTIGANFIAGALSVFQDMKFEDLFFLT